MSAVVTVQQNLSSIQSSEISPVTLQPLAVHIIRTMSNKAFAIIAGVGSGTGASIARRFAKSYPVALLARNATSYESLVQEINNSGGKAYGVATDVSSEESVKNALKKIESEFGSGPCAAAIYQASGGFVKKPFLEMSMDDFDKSWVVTV